MILVSPNPHLIQGGLSSCHCVLRMTWCWGQTSLLLSLFRHSFASTDSLAIGNSLRYVQHVSPRFDPKYNKYPAPSQHSKSDKLASNILELPKVRVCPGYHGLSSCSPWKLLYILVVTRKSMPGPPRSPQGERHLGAPPWQRGKIGKKSWETMGFGMGAYSPIFGTKTVIKPISISMVLQKARFHKISRMSCNVHPCGVPCGHVIRHVSCLSTVHSSPQKLTEAHGEWQDSVPKKNWVVKTPTDQVRTLPKTLPNRGLAE